RAVGRPVPEGMPVRDEPDRYGGDGEGRAGGARRPGEQGQRRGGGERGGDLERPRARDREPQELVVRAASEREQAVEGGDGERECRERAQERPTVSRGGEQLVGARGGGGEPRGQRRGEVAIRERPAPRG